MDLKKTLISTQRREDSGSSTSSRYDYQKNIAICMLLDLHNENNDYALVLDYHDDILILDSAQNPKKIDFYQVKTRSQGSWTKSSLLKRDIIQDRRELFSILGKLYQNKIHFPSNTSSLNFVTNAIIKLTMFDGTNSQTKEKFCMNKLDKSVIDEIKNSIAQEHSLKGKPNCEDFTYFKVDNLSLSDHSTHTIGKLEQFLQKQIPGRYSSTLVYRSLFDHVKRKTNYNGKQVSSFQELLIHKSISRTEFEKIIKEYESIKDKNSMDQWINIENRLNSENFTIAEVKNLRLSYRKYLVEKIGDNSLLLEASERIKEILDKLDRKGKLRTTLKEILENCLSEYNNQTIVKDLYNEDSLKAIILYLVYD